MTTYALVFAGVVPLAVQLYAIASSATIDVADLTLSLGIGLGVIISAVRAWRSDPKGRISLLTFVTLHYLLVGWNNLVLVADGQLAGSELGRALGRALRGLLYPATYLWYFNRARTKQFYLPSPTAQSPGPYEPRQLETP